MTSAHRRRPRRSAARVAATGVIATLFLAMLAGGGLEKASHWFGEQMVGQMVPADPAPAEEPRTSRTKQQKKERRDKR